MLRGSSESCSRPISTVILTAPEQQTLDELECVVAATVRVLTQALQAGQGLGHGATWVVAGAGCTEAFLSHELRKLAQPDSTQSTPLLEATASVRRAVHRAIINYAECLEIAGGMCTADAAWVAQQWVPEEMSNEQSENDQPLTHCYGWAQTDKVCVMTSRQELNGAGDRVLVADSDCVLDSLEAKLAALSTACDVANCLLRIDMAIEG